MANETTQTTAPVTTPAPAVNPDVITPDQIEAMVQGQQVVVNEPAATPAQPVVPAAPVGRPVRRPMTPEEEQAEEDATIVRVGKHREFGVFANLYRSIKGWIKSVLNR